MKVHVKDSQPKPEFEPITLQITIESAEELCDLWHRINASPSLFRGSHYPQKAALAHGATADEAAEALWDELNGFVTSRGLKSSADGDGE